MSCSWHYKAFEGIAISLLRYTMTSSFTCIIRSAGNKVVVAAWPHVLELVLIRSQIPIHHWCSSKRFALESIAWDGWVKTLCLRVKNELLHAEWGRWKRSPLPCLSGMHIWSPHKLLMRRPNQVPNFLFLECLVYKLLVLPRTLIGHIIYHCANCGL